MMSTEAFRKREVASIYFFHNLDSDFDTSTILDFGFRWLLSDVVVSISVGHNAPVIQRNDTLMTNE